MRFRTLALALALSCGVTGVVQAKQHAPKPQKTKKYKPSKRYKQSKAAKVKPRKARKVKHA